MACCRAGEMLWHHTGMAILTMRPFSNGFLDTYLAGQADRVTASVGGYQIESIGLQLFDKIEGDHFTILGLPLLPLLNCLREVGELPS